MRMNLGEKRQLQRVIERLDHVVGLAKIAAGGVEPEYAAEYLVLGIRDVAPELQTLRRVEARLLAEEGHQTKKRGKASSRTLAAATGETWASLHAGFDAVRAGYLREVEVLAQELQPRLESGELGDWPAGDETDRPRLLLDKVCGERFGLQATEVPVRHTKPVQYETVRYTGGDVKRAELVLLLSPSYDIEEIARGYDWCHPCLAAAAAVALDVIAVARKRGWLKHTAKKAA